MENGSQLILFLMFLFFVVNLGNVMQVVSNGKLKPGEHQVVTNENEARESAAVFLCPADDHLFGPAKDLTNDENPPIYRDLHYHELLAAHNRGRTFKLSSDQTLKTFLLKT